MPNCLLFSPPNFPVYTLWSFATKVCKYPGTRSMTPTRRRLETQNSRPTPQTHGFNLHLCKMAGLDEDGVICPSLEEQLFPPLCQVKECCLLRDFSQASVTAESCAQLEAPTLGFSSRVGKARSQGPRTSGWGEKNQHTEGGSVSLRLVYPSAFLICKQPSSSRSKNYLKDIRFLQTW